MKKSIATFQAVYNDISEETYKYTVDGVETDYTCSLDDDGYPIAPSTES